MDENKNILISTLVARVGYGSAQAAAVLDRCTDPELLEKVKSGDMEAINRLLAMSEQKRAATTEEPQE